MAPSVAELRAQFEGAGQGHVFAFWDSLNATQQAELLAQLQAINPQRVNQIFQNAMKSSKIDPSTVKIAPLPASVYLNVNQCDPETLKKYQTAGMQAIQQGKVAVLLLAGGQGTRLGSSAPKGCYNIGLPSGKSLFQLQAERLRRLQTLSGGKLPWYVMVSGPTRADTEAFFKSHQYFGLDAKDVFFFEQGTLPAFTAEGKIILEKKEKVSIAPDGNGGVYAALEKEGVLADMKKRGIEYVHAYCVDNCLVKIADPIFLGYNILAKAEVGAKTVRKEDPAEPVGVVCLRNGKYGVVEYSEIPKELSQAKNADGSLQLSSANIANHFYTRRFLETVQQLESQMEFHIAHKKIAYVDPATGQAHAPTSPNGYKMELFIFDVFPFCTQFAVYEGHRKEEFSPLKNKEGVDSPLTSCQDIMNLHKKYLKEAGAQLVGDGPCEISPLVSYAGEGLEKYRGQQIQLPAHLQ